MEYQKLQGGSVISFLSYQQSYLNSAPEKYRELLF